MDQIRSFYEAQCRFSAAHRYIQKEWDDQRNRREFGPCFNAHGHGHDYRLKVEIELRSREDQESLDLALSSLRKQLDHRHINEHIEDFQNGKSVPTSENLARYCALYIHKQAPALALRKISLFEVSSLWVELNSEDLKAIARAGQS